MAKAKPKLNPRAKPKAKAQAKPRSRAVAPIAESRGDDTRQVISTRDLTYLAGYADTSLSKAGNITSTLGQEISTYAKTRGLNAQAFKDALKCLRKAKRDPIAARAYLDDREDYCERMGVNKLAASDMFKGGERKGGKRQSAQKDLSEREDAGEGDPASVTNLDQHREGNGADNEERSAA